MGCDETLRLWDEHGQGRKRVISNDRRALFLSNVGGSIDGELVDHNEEFTADVIGEESEIQQTANHDQVERMKDSESTIFSTEQKWLVDDML